MIPVSVLGYSDDLSEDNNVGLSAAFEAHAHVWWS